MTQRISLWASPRNISTALMYSFAQREDFRVVDEPLYAYYLKNSKAKEYHPMAYEIMNSLPTEENEVIETLLKEYPNENVFFKNMSHHLLHINRDFLKHMKHILLTRDPKDMLLSFSKVINQPKMEDVGYKSQYDLIEELNSMQLHFKVLDSKVLLKNPEITLSKLCEFLEIPFDRKMLSWKSGPISEDGIWASHWYKSVHQSTGFQKYEPKNQELPGHLQKLYEECMIYYQKFSDYNL